MKYSSNLNMRAWKVPIFREKLYHNQIGWYYVNYLFFFRSVSKLGRNYLAVLTAETDALRKIYYTDCPIMIMVELFQENGNFLCPHI